MGAEQNKNHAIVSSTFAPWHQSSALGCVFIVVVGYRWSRAPSTCSWFFGRIIYFFYVPVTRMAALYNLKNIYKKFVCLRLLTNTRV